MDTIGSGVHQMSLAALHRTKGLTSVVLALAAFSLLPVGLAQPPASTLHDMDENRLREIRPRLQELTDKQQVPGVVYLVAHHGRIVAHDAVGMANVEDRKPMQKDSIFQIMSMTKNFTGVAIMMLVEEGKIDLKSPIEDYLPEFKGILVEEKSPDGKITTHPPQFKPTVWQLMDHTSGLDGDR